MNELVERIQKGDFTSDDILGAAELLKKQTAELSRKTKTIENCHELLGRKDRLIEQQAGKIAVAAEMAEALEHFGGDPIADEPLGKWKELNK